MCAILDGELDDSTAQALSISENLVREDVCAKDLIDACTELYRKYGSVKSVAEELGLPQHRVRAFVKFDRLRPALKQHVETGKLDVKSALRLEDHFGSEDPPPERIADLVDQISGMTNVQQMHYLRDIRSVTPRGNGAPDRQFEDEPTRPGAVHQVLVTLSTEGHLRLRQWAKSQQLTQDRAAATIINAFFRSAMRRREQERPAS
jgi:ParB family chromosome partitioning protein